MTSTQSKSDAVDETAAISRHTLLGALSPSALLVPASAAFSCPRTMNRTLRSKRLRNALWISADGKCQKCGRDLPPDWHADHVIPWIVSGDTNVHDMQALCQRCNLRKGVGMLRKPQQRMRQICREIRGGEKIRRIIASVTPGGGKSLLPVIVASELIPNFYDRLCWVVPRVSLQEQAEEAFMNRLPEEIEIGGREIRKSTNEMDPSRDKAGFVTTYQAIASDQGESVSAEFLRHRYILVLDEPHHVEDGGKWHAAIKRLVDRAGLIVFMSGTLQRGQRSRIAELSYADDLRCDLRDTEDTRVIQYGRKAALGEHSIIPIEFIHGDGNAKWLSPVGVEMAVDSLADLDEPSGAALWAALHTPFAIELLDQCLNDWSSLRKSRPRSKLLVVAANIKIAKTYLEHVKARGFKALIATSEESEEAQKNIKRFKKTDHGACDILVTVQMAYEGLDVPSITHIACLTHIRSAPWIEQMLARATRYDRDAGPWGQQFATVYTPDDPLMKDVISEIEAEQLAAANEGKDVAGGGGAATASPPEDPKNDVIPLDGQLLKCRASDFENGSAGHAETQKLQEIIQSQGLPIGTMQLKRAIAAYQSSDDHRHDENRQDDHHRPTASQREKRLKDAINEFCKRMDRDRFSMEWGKTNGLVIRAFNKSRETMTEKELQQVWAWLQQRFGAAEAAG